jgi:glycosyltransferase involved in cell wall biosynthesis
MGMKILIVMDPGILVPPKGYGGHERLVEMVAKQYLEMGHEVHLLVTEGSSVPGCTIHSIGKEGFPPKKMDALKAIPFAWKFLWKHRNYFDMVHNFGRLAYLLPIFYHPVKKIMTYGREINRLNIRFMNIAIGKNIVYTGCSSNLLSRVKATGTWETVYNAIDFNKYSLRPYMKADAPLVFLGRIEKFKGCHTAIKIALATGNKLIIAGNISPLKEEQLYFKKEIEPYIDGIQIRYVGQLNDEQKNEYLGQAKVLLFPIEWNEPFGIVMIEAMACGTPVIAFNRGSVNEVIDEGITGFKVNNMEEMIDALAKIDTISRTACREQAEMRFDAAIIASRYIKMIDEKRKKVLIITTSQPAANPRVLKEYEELLQSGCRVKVLYNYNANWSYKIDENKFKNGELKRQDFVIIGGNPFNGKINYFISRAVFRLFLIADSFFSISFLRKMTTERTAFYLWIIAKRYKADIYIAHYLGALPAAIKAAKRNKARVIYDAEDFYRGELPYYASQIKNIIAVENELLPKVDFITTASPLISVNYQKLYPDKKIVTINNVFSKKYLQHSTLHYNKLRLFWFSQNVGINRGLEIFITALNYLPGYDIDLTIMGTNRSQAYKNKLLALADQPEKIIFKEPIVPEAIFPFAAKFDVGLAGEIPNCINKEICLSNKLFTYLLAGNCVLTSDTTAQKMFLEHYPGIGLLYKYNDPESLAAQIKRLYDDRALLADCKRSSLDLAKSIMNWEQESKKFREIIGI